MQQLLLVVGERFIALQLHLCVGAALSTRHLQKQAVLPCRRGRGWHLERRQVDHTGGRLAVPLLWLAGAMVRLVPMLLDHQRLP